MECFYYIKFYILSAKGLSHIIKIILRFQKLKCCMMTGTEGHSRHFDGKIFVEKKVLSLHYF